MENKYFFKFWCFEVQLLSFVFSNLSFLSASVHFVYNVHAYNKNDLRSSCNAWPHLENYHFCFQSTALVHVYLDGSVSLSHGGCEMGQGLNMKILQVS